MIQEVLADNRQVSPLFPASTAVSIGDLLWYDSATNLVKLASARTDTGSTAGNQADFAPLFFGVSDVQRLAGETVSQRRGITQDGIFDCDCSSQTWKYGDLVAVDRNTGGTVNYNQQVAKVTNPALAIGLCVKDEASAVTKVRVRLTGKWAFNLGHRKNGLFGDGNQSSTALSDADTTLTVASNTILTGVPTAARKVILPDPTLSAGRVFVVVNNSGGSFNLNVRDNGDTTTIQGVAQNKRAIFFCDGTTWFGLLGA